MAYVQINVKPEVREKLRQVSKLTGQKIAFLTEQAVEDYLNNLLANSKEYKLSSQLPAAPLTSSR